MAPAVVSTVAAPGSAALVRAGRQLRFRFGGSDAPAARRIGLICNYCGRRASQPHPALHGSRRSYGSHSTSQHRQRVRVWSSRDGEERSQASASPPSLLEEILDPALLGTRGEAWFAIQGLLILGIVFSPRKLDEVSSFFNPVLLPNLKFVFPFRHSVTRFFCWG